MSSEHRYDYSYEQFVQDDLPSLSLFGDITFLSDVDPPFYGLQENCPADLQQNGQPFSHGADTPKQSQQIEVVGDPVGKEGFGIAAMPQPSASGFFAPPDHGTTLEGPRSLVLYSGRVQDRADEFQASNNTAGGSQISRSEVAQTSLWRTHGVLTIEPAPLHNTEQGEGWTSTFHGSDQSTGIRPIQALADRSNAKWSGPQRCHWPKCASKAMFRSPSSLSTHVTNIHVAPLVCTHQGCSYKKPFGKPCDLRRHVATVHNTECAYQCLESDCQEIFSRKDKMMNHAKEKHELLKCSYNHCPAVVFVAQRESHLQDSHGHFECAIGSCKLGHKSSFTHENLKRHMRTCHRMTFDPILTTLRNLIQDTKESQVLYAKTRMRPAYRDCVSCSPNASNK